MPAEDGIGAAGSIRDEACQWVVRLDSGRLTAEGEQALRDWLARSPRHKAELMRLGVLWDGLDALIESQVSAGLITAAPRGTERFRPWLFPAGVFATCLVLVFTVLAVLEPDPTDASVFHITRIGEQKTVTLADGSSVVLNTGSQLEERISGEQRLVRLVRGEALFTVKPDDTRPFLVLVGSGAVRALGTAFAVYLHDENIEVTVVEGQVELSTFAPDAIPDTAASPPGPRGRRPTVLARIEAGHRATFNDGLDTIAPIAAAEIDRKLSWRTGILLFDGVPLAQMVAEASRYSELDFVIADEAIGELRISGRFRIGDTAKLLAVLESSFGIRADHSTPGRVYLVPAE